MGTDDSGGRFRKKRVNFSMVSNEIIRDPEVSLKAKGLYSLIQSYITIEDFIVYKRFLLSQCSEGKKAFESAWKELKDTGYLLQYRMQDEKKHFYYEYELLDSPVLQKGATANKPIPQKGYTPKGVASEKDNTLNGGNINNTYQSNILPNNNNQLISFADVMEQIGYCRETVTDIVENIINLMVEILNTADDAIIRVNKQNISAIKVKERFKLVGYSEIEHITLVLSQYTAEIGSLRNFMITTIYNSPTTSHIYFQTKVNHDMYGSK